MPDNSQTCENNFLCKRTQTFLVRKEKKENWLRNKHVKLGNFKMKKKSESYEDVKSLKRVEKNERRSGGEEGEEEWRRRWFL